jgi:hypothetical protein
VALAVLAAALAKLLWRRELAPVSFKRLALPFVALLGFAPAWAATIACFVLYDVIDEGFEVDFMLRDTALHLVILATLPFALRRAPRPLAAQGAAP